MLNFVFFFFIIKIVCMNKIGDDIVWRLESTCRS